jgi:hypothetical protein
MGRSLDLDEIRKHQETEIKSVRVSSTSIYGFHLLCLSLDMRNSSGTRSKFGLHFTLSEHQLEFTLPC